MQNIAAISTNNFREVLGFFSFIVYVVKILT